MESPPKKPGTETREPAERRARPLPRTFEPDETGQSDSTGPRRAGEPVTAYDHFWFERRPLT